MIELKIGPNSRSFNNVNEIDESWIVRQVTGSGNNRIPPCIRIAIEEGAINMLLATQGCASSGGGSRLPNREESRIFELWREMKLDGKNFQMERFITFFKRVRNLLN